MGKAILLTGTPGSGKTTLLRKVIAALQSPAGGFYTQEIRQSGVRQGFEIITLDGQRDVLAHVEIRHSPRIGKYGVNLAGLDHLAVGAIQNALHSGALVVVDEIGPMELLSKRFQAAVLEVFDSDEPLLGTIFKRSLPFVDAIKRRPGVTLIEVHRDNRDSLPQHVLGLLQAIRQA